MVDQVVSFLPVNFVPRQRQAMWCIDHEHGCRRPSLKRTGLRAELGSAALLVKEDRIVHPSIMNRPFERLDAALNERAPAEHCCGYCCCRKHIGLRAAMLWTTSLLMCEAIWHIAISVLRPSWEWNSTAVTVIAFLLQDVARALVFAASFAANSAVRQFTRPETTASVNAEFVKSRVGLLFRILCSLIFLELLELTVKSFEVHMVCTAPYVKQARMRRHPNMTAAELHKAEERCETISDIYDYVFEFLTIALLIYLVWIVHSFRRSIVPANENMVTDNESGGDYLPGERSVEKVEGVVVVARSDDVLVATVVQ